MSRWKRVSSERLIVTTLVLFASSIGGVAGCEIFSQVDRSQIPTNAGGGGNGGTAESSSSTGSMTGGMGGAAGMGGTAGTGGTGGTGGIGGAGGTGGTVCTPVDDNNDCTTDECVNGLPVNTPVTAGSMCMTNGGSMCDPTGACVECLLPVDCAGTDDACQTRTCTAGKCGFDYTAANTTIPTQTAGDCKVTVCDGTGGQKDNTDDTDLPVDQNACTDDVCNGGVASNPNRPAGTNCGMNGSGDPLICNDAGQCVGCITGADCAGTDTECSARTCNNSICGVSYTPANTPVMMQTDNNCLLHVCDGSGAIVDIADDTDLPLDDGNACTSETCAAGMPNHPNTADGSPCMDSDLCTTMDTCQMGVCTTGAPVTCMPSDQCHIAGTCDPMTGMCTNPSAMDGIMCNDGNPCTQTDACSSGTCNGSNPVVCMASDQCHVAGMCDPMTGMCTNPNAADGTMCNDGNPCTQTDACSSGSCTGTNAVTCMASDQCHIAGMCDPMTGMCSNPVAMDGTMCTSGTTAGTCAMGTCVACGDGILGGVEACDDGNATAGDGCNATCGVESGWSCTGTPSVCTPVCGDGVIIGTESCDDTNMTAGDGCSSTCQIEITCAANETKIILHNNTSIAIPDGNMTGILSPVTVNQIGGVTKAVAVLRSLTHTYDSDLGIYLISPQAVQRELSTGNGSTDDNYKNTTFDDAAATAVTVGTAPFSGLFRPEQSLTTTAGADFRNLNGQGTWNLKVVDTAPTDTGTLEAWSLALCINPNTYCGNGTTEAGEECDDGNTNNTDACTNQCRLSCGDRTLTGTEQCDDGNRVDGDGCSSTCQLDIACGAGEVQVLLTQSTSTAIPDNAQGGISSFINVAQAGVVRKVIPTINITHSNTGHVDTWLISPFGVERDLATDIGTSANFTATTFSDTAATAITAGVAPYTGTYRPEFTISDAAGFGNQSATGQWSLRVADDTSTVAGTLNSWTVALCIDPNVTSVCGNGYVEQNEQCDDGNAMSGDGCSSCQLEFTCGANETLVFLRSTDAPQIIPAGIPAGVTSSVSVTNPGIVAKAAVVVNSLSHTYDGDLSLSLTSPGGTTLDLSSGNGGTNDDYVSTILSDAAATNVTAGVAPFRGSYKPEQALSGLNIQPAAGTWTFKAVDALASEAGQLNSWSLALCVGPLPVCGNGLPEAGEGCDDGNTIANDGCTSCVVDPGYLCTGAPSVCTMLSCGDGAVTGTEECDDMNTVSGDGCTNTCLIEQGYTCTGMPNVCTFTCGNGNVTGSELCDDGNTTNGDGCSSVCLPDITCNAGEVPVVIHNRTSAAIPDGADGGIASLINVTQTGVVRRVVPTLNVTHPNDGHIDAWLIGPYGVERDLATDVGTAANFLGTQFSDSAATAITAGTAPYTGVFRPEFTISDAAGFGNQSANGNWSLRIADDTSTLTGNLKAWSLALCVDPAVPNVCGNGYVEPNEQCDDGNMVSGDGCNSCQLEFTCGANQTFVFLKSTALPQIIPAAVPAGITSTIAVTQSGVVGKAAVVVNSISHTYDGDLSLTVTSPAGTTIDLSSSNGSSFDNYASTVLADAATTLVTTGSAPFRGYFKPEQALSGLIAQPATGNWTFKAVDSSISDAGHLNSWGLALCVGPTPVCGNGAVDIGEACDDTNTTAGDGCSATCTVEPGYRCTGSPSTCVPLVCGDGILSGTEECDDNNTTANDGCSATCAVEPGYTCTGTPAICTFTCGNGNITGNELCDDGNTMSGDGCSSTCLPDITCNAGEVPVVIHNRTSATLPDGPEGGIASVINVTQAGVVRKVVPTLNVTHTNTGHIDSWLVSPYGIQRELATDVGTGANFLGTSFDDAAATAITAGTAPYTGRFRPEQTISNAAGFANQSGNGNWSLRMADDTSGTTGSLKSWSLALCLDPAVPNVCGNGYVEPNEQCDDTNMVSGDGCSNCQLEFNCGANQTPVLIKSTAAPQIIPDAIAAGITSVINVPNTGLVGKAIVVINSLPHHYDGDVAISLISTGNTTLDLSSGNGAANDDYLSTILADAAGTAVTAGVAPFRGYFRPEQALSAVIGQVSNGNWTLKVADTASVDTGLLNSWSLGLCVGATPICGNGTLEIGEPCDDMNTTAGDGCSATCTIEQGYICSGAPSSCVLSCGDGVLNGTDQCDDNNTTANDGCSSTCTVEAGYTCTGAPSACVFTCGNGVVTGAELCDDGNTTANDSCNSVCQWEKVAEVEPNGTTTEADANFTINGTLNVTGSLTASDKDIFKVVVSAADTVVSFETFDASGRDCIGMVSTRLTLLNSVGVTLKQDTLTAGISNCSELAVLLQPGTYYIQVDNVAGTAVPNYFLRTLFHVNNMSETEPNDVQAQANANNGYVTQIYGSHQILTDTDWFSLTVPQGGSLRIETVEGDASETCESNGIDSTLTLINSAGMTLVSDTDTGRGWCSQIDGTGATPANAAAKNLAAGTYYIRVTSNGTTGASNQFNYRLVTIVR